MFRWLLILSFAASPALAEPLPLSAALSRARETSREVLLARGAVEEARATRVGAGVFLNTNPRLYGDYRRLATELVGQPVDPRDGFLAGLDGMIEISGASFARIREAKERARVAGHELEATQASAIERAWVGYVSAQVADARAHAMRESLDLQKRVEAATKERVRLGVASEADSATVGVEGVTVRTLLMEEQRMQQLAQLELKQALDYPGLGLLELDPLSVPPEEARDDGALVAKALQKRPELAAARARLGLLEATDSRLFREALPKLGYNGGVDAAPASPAFGFVGLSFDIPVAQRNQGPRAVVRAQKQSEATRLETELRMIAREVAAMHASYLTRRAQFEQLDREAKPLAERSVELVEAGWRAGRFDIFRFINTTRELLRVKRERLDLLLAAWSDYIALQRATGVISP